VHRGDVIPRAELDKRDGVERRVELRVGQVLD
jgi:hypothetical protein